MLPTGHEGPYDLLSIKQRCQKGGLSPDVKVWAEGLKSPVTAQVALTNSEESLPAQPITTPLSTAHILAEKMSQEESQADDLPPLPEEEIPPLPMDAVEETEPLISERKRSSRFVYLALGVFFLSGFVFFFTTQWIKSHEKFEIRRHPRMSVALHERIQKELAFKGWNQKIFFKEYVPADLSQIWLVTQSFQSCQVEAKFESVPGKLISLKEEPVAFKSTGNLSGHVVEFSAFEFSSGTKILPGMYEVDIKATQCQWDGLPARLANLFNPVEEQYLAKTKVILFPKGADEYNQVLANLLKKKLEEEQRRQSEEEMFWQDLQQKLQTLLAISLQIEQHFLDFLDRGPKDFKLYLPLAVDVYTDRFGHFLTNFVVSNETYFQQLGDLEGRSKKRNYELLLSSTSKKIGNESMKLIEEMQKIKKPNKGTITSFEAKLKAAFAELKNDINQKIIQISEDRSS